MALNTAPRAIKSRTQVPNSCNGTHWQCLHGDHACSLGQHLSPCALSSHAWELFGQERAVRTKTVPETMWTAIHTNACQWSGFWPRLGPNRGTGVLGQFSKPAALSYKTQQVTSMLISQKWKSYLQIKSHAVENNITATNTATRSLAEVGTGCARFCKDICGRKETTSLLPCDRTIEILKDGGVRKGEGHLERWVDEGQTFSSHCKPTWGKQEMFQKQRLTSSSSRPEDISREKRH